MFKSPNSAGVSELAYSVKNHRNIFDVYHDVTSVYRHIKLEQEVIVGYQIDRLHQLQTEIHEFK